QEPTSVPPASWVIPLESLSKEPALVPPASWVMPLATLQQGSTTAPPVNWVLPLATVQQDIGFTELQELSELLGKLKSCVDVAMDNAPEAAKS
ncbi:TPA: hypothetical protein L3844_002513, partial [Pseudomonas aeruginosa]|nr:hypothetical protein [Pseudomonas aeruginosa]HEP8935433.1 hypothetical protein [Pseudomonas aeruginosa]